MNDAGKSAAFLEIRQLVERERAWVAAGHPPRVFYHPGYTANGHVTRRGRFVPHGIPEGSTLDVAAWEADGRSGPAPVCPPDRRASAAVEEHEEGSTASEASRIFVPEAIPAEVPVEILDSREAAVADAGERELLPAGPAEECD